MMVFATVWQAFESPTRAQSSERALTGACMLAVFERTLRTLSPAGRVVRHVFFHSDASRFVVGAGLFLS